MIAIHHSPSSFSDRWIACCKIKNIPFKVVDCYQSDIMRQLADCDALMWHFNHQSSKDVLFAKQLLYSVQAAGKKVFPDYNTMWHFDDKVGQKYLLEAIGAPLVPTWICYDRQVALGWVEKTDFPKVFKLRGGAGSANVRLVKTKSEAVKLINQAFGSGFSQYNALGNLKERIRKYRLGKTELYDVLKGFIRLAYPTKYSIVAGRERGYVYFQDFIACNDHDIRVIVIDNKAFAIKRMIRKDDFRASGSGNIVYEKKNFNEATIKMSFLLTEKLQAQCIAFDYVYHNGQSLLVEISYGFAKEVYDPCVGYWDKEMNWYEGAFNPYEWMVKLLFK
ncbi:MAG: hypothetical protein HKK67_05545 [Chlorobiaceae bacterium]|nr:hypothetical protein [Chlorobiaceae bacterium]